MTRPEPRRLTCARCGAPFECGSTVGHCWCAEEDFRLPMPAAGEDCLCPACLRKAAAGKIEERI
ncbi:MAG: cysteine-rich CWC family protein [Alphaproteobacteria bacterium]